jgi:hypothetical protein
LTLIWLNFFHCSHNTILLKLSDGYRKPTDVEMSDKSMLKEKPDRKLYHVTAPLLQTSLVQVVAYPFSWFTKFHGFMILTGTTKIGIQQIKLSIHTSEENYENFIYCILHIFKFVNCNFYHFIIMLYCTQY